MTTHLEVRRLAGKLAACVAAASVAWVATVGLPAQAAARHQKSRMLDKSAARAQAMAASGISPSSESSSGVESTAAAVSAAPAASAASAAASASAPASSSSSPAKSTTDVTLSVGAVFARNDTSHSRTTPFLLTVERGNFHGEISGDGQSHLRGAKDVDDFGDVSALVAYNFVIGDLTLQPHFQWTFPSGNDAGSQRSGQELALKFKQKLGKLWWLSVTPSIARDTEDDARSVEYARNISAKLSWAHDDDLQAFVEVVRSHPAGDRVGTTVSAELDFPICKKLDGDINLSRTVSGSKSANAIEFDLTWSF